MKLVDISGSFFWVKVFPAHKEIFFLHMEKRAATLCFNVKNFA